MNATFATECLTVKVEGAKQILWKSETGAQSYKTVKDNYSYIFRLDLDPLSIEFINLRFPIVEKDNPQPWIN